jgi:hypothetical protein
LALALALSTDEACDALHQVGDKQRRLHRGESLPHHHHGHNARGWSSTSLDSADSSRGVLRALADMRSELLHERHVLKRALKPRDGGLTDAVQSLWDPSMPPPSTASSSISSSSFATPRDSAWRHHVHQRAGRRMHPRMHAPPPPPRPPTADDEMVRCFVGCFD